MISDEVYFSNASLCWRCRRSCVDRCSWAARFEPVKGWEAESRMIEFRPGYSLQSYRVISCPEFDGRPLSRDPKTLHDNGCENFGEAIVRRAREDFVAPIGIDSTLTSEYRQGIERFLREIGCKETVITALRREALINDYVKVEKNRKKIESILADRDGGPEMIEMLRAEAAKAEEEKAKREKEKKAKRGHNDEDDLL